MHEVGLCRDTPRCAGDERLSGLVYCSPRFCIKLGGRMCVYAYAQSNILGAGYCYCTAYVMNACLYRPYTYDTRRTYVMYCR